MRSKHAVTFGHFSFRAAVSSTSWVLCDTVRRYGEGFDTGPKPYRFIVVGDIHGPNPYKFIGFGDIYGPKPFKFVGLGAPNPISL